MEAQSGPAPLEPRADDDHTRVQVKHVNIKNCWLRGAEQAAAILQQALVRVDAPQEARYPSIPSGSTWIRSGRVFDGELAAGWS